jgi:hypothetical protein
MEGLWAANREGWARLDFNDNVNLTCIVIVAAFGLDEVFTDVNLESQPTKIPTVETVSAKPFAPSALLPEDEAQILKSTLMSLAEHLKFRQTSIKPFFKDFDKVKC